jgi:hypothetical protein
MSRPLPWCRLERDFHSTPSILEVCDEHPPAEVLAAYAITLAEAARADGTYANADALARSLRVYARIRPARATAIVASFVATGILIERDGLLQLHGWESLRPGERHLTKSQRIATQDVATATQPDTRSVEDQTRQEKTRQEKTRADQPTTRIVDGAEVVFAPLLEKPEPRTICSHGERFEERTGSDGRRFWSAGHKTPGGGWCKEQR